VKITISKENYLKAIAEAESEGEVVISATLARWLSVSAPAVTMAVKRLKRDSLIRVSRDGQILLTAAGREITTRLRVRHHLIERMLTEMFGMEWYKVHEEAEQLEHVVSEDFEKRLFQKLGIREACPHGNRVGMDTPDARRKRGLEVLGAVDDRASVRVVSVFERDRPLLEYLDSVGVRPGTQISVITRDGGDGLQVKIGSRQVKLREEAAGRIWVQRTRPPRTAA